jgi:hypothetical protein
MKAQVYVKKLSGVSTILMDINAPKRLGRLGKMKTALPGQSNLD